MLGLFLLAFAGAPDGAAVAFDGAFPITRPDRVYPIEEVKRGDIGVGYTVFEGDALEPFGVEVLGVMEGMLGPGEDVILARLTGPRIEFTGVISGMSGSPVYIDGRLLGAVSYRFGSFSREPIAGITPIARMLAAADAPGEGVRAALQHRAFSPEDLRGRGEVGAIAWPFEDRAHGSARPIAVPLSTLGLSASAADTLQRRTTGLGPSMAVSAAAAPGASDAAFTSGLAANGASEVGRTPALPIGPGSPVAAMLVNGDIRISAIGTVTYVHGDDVLAFGHPFVGFGPVAYPMATAAILNTLASGAGSYKQGIASREVGVIEQDRLTAITGALGARGRTVPVSIRVGGLGSGTREVEVEIVDDPVWLPIMLESVLETAMTGSVRANPGGTVDVAMRIEVAERSLQLSERFTAPAPASVAGFAARDLASVVGILARNDLEQPEFSSIRVEADLSDEVEPLDIRSVTARGPATAGDTLAVDVELDTYRGARQRVRLEVPVPTDLQGEAELFVGGGLATERIIIDRGRRTPRSLDDLLDLFADRLPSVRLYGLILRSDAEGLTLPGRSLPNPPLSLRALIGDDAPKSESVVVRVSVPVEGVVSGEARTKILVKRKS